PGLRPGLAALCVAWSTPSVIGRLVYRLAGVRLTPSTAPAQQPRGRVKKQRRFRVMDVVVLAAAALLVHQAPASGAAAGWVPTLEPLPRLALAGLVAGYLVERTRVLAVFGIPLVAVLGAEAVTYVYAPVASATGSMSARVNALGESVGTWLTTVAS